MRKGIRQGSSFEFLVFSFELMRPAEPAEVIKKNTEGSRQKKSEKCGKSLKSGKRQKAEKNLKV